MRRLDGLRIGVAAASRRVVMAWKPLFDELQRRGARLELLEFPRGADPDSRGLDDLPWPVRLSTPAPLGKDFTPSSVALEKANARVREALSQDALNIVLCCSANLPPENQLRSALSALPRPPVVVGLQHGFVQWWASYTETFDFDLFGVFGPGFVNAFPKAQRDRVVALSMTELAGLPAATSEGDTLLFVAQEEPSAEIVRPLLLDLSGQLGLTPRIRPHPEHRRAFASLSDEIAFSDNPDLLDDFRDSAVVVSTGSTAVLKALAMGRRVVVLPVQGGEAFASLGIVAEDFSIRSAVAVLERQAQKGFEIERRRFLEEWCGDITEQAPAIAAEALIQALGASSLLERTGALAIDDLPEAATRDDRKAKKEKAAKGGRSALVELETTRIRSEALQQELDVARSRLRADADKLIEARAEAARLEARLEILKEAHDEHRASRADVDRLRGLADDQESRIGQKDAYIVELEAARQALIARHDELEKALRDAIPGAESRLAQKDAYIAELERAGHSAEKDARIADLEAALDEARQDATDVAYRLRTLESEERRGGQAAPELEKLKAALADLIGARQKGVTDIPLIEEARALIERLETDVAARADAVAAVGQLDTLVRQLRMKQTGAQAEAFTLRDNAWQMGNRITELEGALAASEASRGEVDLEVRRLRTQAAGTAAEFELLRGKVAEMDHLPWRVIAIYRRLRRFVPTGLLVFIARFLPRPRR